MNAKNVIIGIGIFAAVVFLSFVAIFFYTLNTTVSDFSGGDVCNINQIYYNFFHGRPFQLTTYLGESVQFYNPYMYFNILVIHGYILSTAIVAFFYIFWPGVNTMYAVFIALNFFGFAFFTFKIVKRLSPSNAYLKSLLAFSVFLSSGYLLQTVAKGIHITLAGPFILAAYYFLISEKKYAFFLTIVSLCLIQEDLAIFAVTFLITLLIFEKKCKKAVYLSLAFSIGYFILWNFILQPVLRYDMILVDSRVSSMLSARFRGMLETLFPWRPDTRKCLVIFSGFYLPALAAVLIYRFFGVSRRLPWLKILSFVVLAPAAHLIYGTFCLFGPYLVPALTMAYLSFLLFLSGISFDWKKKVTRSSFAILSAVIGIFLTVDIIVMTPTLPFSPRIYTWKIIKKLTGIEIFQRKELQRQVANYDEWQKQTVSNKNTIKIVKDIPAEKSVVFWGNYIICGFLTDRNDFWLFPMCYDLVDFLVIQKDAKYSIFTAEGLKDLDYKELGFWDKICYVRFGGAVSGRLTDKIREDLVENRHTHRVACDTKYVLVLERLTGYKIYMPKSSIGFGWVENIPKFFSREYLRK